MPYSGCDDIVKPIQCIGDRSIVVGQHEYEIRNSHCPLSMTTAAQVPLSGHWSIGQCDSFGECVAQARSICPTGASDVECSAVINACPNERKSARYVYTVIDPEQLYGNEALIVVLGYDDVELTTTRTH